MSSPETRPTRNLVRYINGNVYAFYSSIVVAVVTVLLALITAYVDLRSTIKDTQRNVQKVETATNSMKDALVEAALIAGKKEGREAEQLRQHDIEAGVQKGLIDDRLREADESVKPQPK